ncbi:C40 family peptidase [Flavonifractor plautii]|uniref:C40 family peptidase n=1 Tax=Flavonifractor plautii TaxID=292800 RepID=UPI00232E55C0|nr:NlpC/P60 family protein [Flavonifractor plautii]MDB7920220.1 NlpC/P60 family protein [Flavonifractor plautii]MDB7944001.1 NlpC/P60 family protein [Flavonifractor plautii]
MRDLKIKPGMGTPKAKLKNPVPKDADSLLKQHMDKRQREKEPESHNPVRYATDRVEKNMRHGASGAADASRRMIKHYRGKLRQGKENAAREYRVADMGIGAESGSTNAPTEYDFSPAQTTARNEVGKQTFSPQNPNAAKKASAAPQERGRQKAIQDAKAAYRRNLAEKRTAERHIVPPPSDRGGTMTTLQKGNLGASAKGSPAPKSGQAMTKATRAMRVRPTDHATPNNAIITHRTRAAAQRKAQRAMLQDSVKNGGNAAKKLSGTAVQAIKAMGRGVASAVSSILSAGGGAVVLVLLLTVILVAAIVASPFGILFSNESREAGVVPISAAVAQVNYDFNERLETLQTADDYDSISVDGQAADWVEVLAVFAVKVAGADVDAADVATMDADRIARLKAVFWDMTTIAHRIEVIHHPGSGDDDGWTERNLYITITAKTAEEMKTAYHFNRNQIAALDELLEQRDLLRELIEDVYSVSGDTAALIRNLPEDLSPEREAVVRTACSLVGKVNYFWGGKSLVIGWDARWGELRQVTAAGSSTTGTYRPYGLDCSGFVDWVFYNQSDGSYVIGHGGGATMQHSYCTNISWADAQPGDLVFYPDNSHVGIVGGWDANGELLIIHCASGYNNVVITGKEGFTSISRPRYYAE